MERGRTDLALTDGKGNHGRSLPSALAVYFVIVFRIRYEAAELRREVAAQLLAESEALDILIPLVHGLVDGAVLAVFQQITQDVAIVCIARHHYGLLEIDRRFMGMAAELVAAEMVSHAAGVHGVRSQNSLL